MCLHKALQIRAFVYWSRSIGLQSRRIEAIFKNMDTKKLPGQNRVLLLEERLNFTGG
jgi:hypothetical protein